MAEYLGFTTPTTQANEINKMDFLISSRFSQLRTCIPVEVLTVKDNGLNQYVVSLRVLIQSVTVDREPIGELTLYNVPVSQIQAGLGAIIIKPLVGDKGFILACDRDITSVLVNKGVSTPNSFRTHSFSDAIYLGCLLNEPPTSYVKIDNDNIEINVVAGVTIDSPTINLKGSVKIEGDLEITGSLVASGEVEADGVKLSTHRHTADGTPTSPPIP